MTETQDFTRHFSSTQGWQEVCHAGKMLLEPLFQRWVTEYRTVSGVKLRLKTGLSDESETVLAVGQCEGHRASYEYPQSTAGQASLVWYGTDAAIPEECYLAAADAAEFIKQIQPRLISADVFRSSPVVMYQAAELNGRWILTQANRALENFTGLPLSAFLGTQATTLLIDLVHPDDVAQLQATYDFTRTTSRQLTLQYRMRNAQGAYVPVTERVEYAESQDVKRCVSVLWHRQLDQEDSEQQFALMKLIERYSHDISFETGMDMLRHFCRRLETIDGIKHLTLAAHRQQHWWETWGVYAHQHQKPDFQFRCPSDLDLQATQWNSSEPMTHDAQSQLLLFGKAKYQTRLALSFEEETVYASILVGSDKPLEHIETIEQMVRLFGLRIVREISQMRIARAQKEQTDQLIRQKEQLTEMVNLLGELDTADDESQFVQISHEHLARVFQIRRLQWLFWASGEWHELTNPNDPHGSEAWLGESTHVDDARLIESLDDCRRKGELHISRSRMQVFWPIGIASAGYLTMVLSFRQSLPDPELLNFTQNSLSLAHQGLRQRAYLRHQAMRDSLTGLGNRAQLHSWVQDALEQTNIASLMLFDLNRFKEINDSFGHQFGDKLLREIGPRIAEFLGDREHFLSRLGGDEFALFVPDISHAHSAALAEGIRECLAKNYVIDGMKFQVDASVGVAHYPDHGNDGHELLRRADVAMYAAKNSNRTVEIFSETLDNTTPLRIAVLSGLDQALEQHNLWVAFQPLMATETGQTAGFEALIRWSHPEYGPLSPAEFIPIAEMGEGIRKLTTFVLRVTMNYLVQWRKQVPDLHVAVNVSPRVLLDHQFPESVAEMLKDHGLPGSSLILELTESTLLVDPVRAIEIINKFAEYDIQVEIDDFGTGYSSLAYLKRLPISALKIDRSFVMDLVTDEHNEVIVQSTIQMAHSLGLKTVAEGVEDEATLMRLMRLKCDMIQGFYYAKPIPGEEVADWLKRNA